MGENPLVSRAPAEKANAARIIPFSVKSAKMLLGNSQLVAPWLPATARAPVFFGELVVSAMTLPAALGPRSLIADGCWFRVINSRRRRIFIGIGYDFAIFVIASFQVTISGQMDAHFANTPGVRV